MTKVPGLTAFPEDKPGGQMRKQMRIQVDEPSSRRQRLSPTAAPVDTFVRAGRPQVDNRLDALIEGLAPMVPALRAFATVKKGDEAQDRYAYANKTLGSMTVKQAEEALKSGSDPKLSAAVADVKGQQLLANKLAAQDVIDAQNDYFNSADRNNVNIDEFIATRRKNRMDQYGGNKFFAEAYNEASASGYEAIRAGHGKFLIERQKGEQLDGVDATFGNIIANGKTQGKSSEEIGRAFWGEAQSNRIMLGMSQEEQDQLVLKHAKGLAEKGDYDTVKALLATKRRDRQGLEHSLLEARTTTAAASNTLQLAERMRNENNRKVSEDANLEFHRQASEGTLDEAAFEQHVKRNPGAFTPDQRRSVLMTNGRQKAANAETVTKLEQERELKVRLQDQDLQMETDALTAARDGQIHNLGPRTVLKKDGETKEMSPKEVQDWAEEKFIQRSSERAQKDGETPEQQFDRELKIVSKNGMTHPTWKRTMTAGAASLSGVALTADKPPAAFAQGYAMYRDLKAKAPHMIGRHIDSNSRELYESARIAEVELGMSPDRALIAAHRATADPEAASSPLNRSKADDIRAKAKSQNTWMPTFLGGSPDIANLGEVGIEIEGRAMLYARLGLSADDALKAAGKTLETTHININGFLVPRMGQRIPADFKKRAETFIRGYANEYGKAEGLDARDLTVRPIGEDANAWMIYNKKTNSPVFVGQHRSFSLQQIEQLAEYERARVQQENERVSGARVEKHQANQALPADKRQLPVAGGIEWKTPLERQLDEEKRKRCPGATFAGAV